MRRLRAILESLVLLLFLAVLFMAWRDHAALESWSYRCTWNTATQPYIWSFQLYLCRGQLEGSLERGETNALSPQDAHALGPDSNRLIHGGRMPGGGLMVPSGWRLKSESTGFIAGLPSLWDIHTIASMPLWPIPLALVLLLTPRIIQLLRRFFLRHPAGAFEILPPVNDPPVSHSKSP